MTTTVNVTGSEASPVMGEQPVQDQLGFQRQNSLTSSGIRRDAAGIPQEMPSFMMQAANAARDNRKSAVTVVSTIEVDGKRKGKAPPRPPHGSEVADLDASTVTMDTNLSRSTDEADGASSRLLNGSLDSKRMNFSDNFAEEVLNCTIDSIEQFELGSAASATIPVRGPSNSSTPKSERKKASSLTESEIMQRSDSLEELHNGHESDVEQEQRRKVPRGNKIELNSSDITVHQSSPSPTPEVTGRPRDSEDSERPEQEDDQEQDESNRRTASLGDLSRLNTPDNALERAQSLEITGETTATAPASTTMTTVTVVNGADGSLQSASDGEQVVVGMMESARTKQRPISTDAAGMDGRDGMLDGLSSLQRNRLKGASAWGNLEDAINSGELLANGDPISDDGEGDDVKIVVKENGYSSESHGTRKPSPAIIVAEAKKIDSVTVGAGGTTLIVGSSTIDPTTTVTEEHISLTTINSTGSYPEPMGESHLVKIGGGGAGQYDTNIPDDVKVSRYPFGSLERPKSDVLKKLLGQKEELENTPSVFISADGETVPGSIGVSKIRIESHRSMDVGEPISLTLINAPTVEVTANGGSSPSFPENEQTESSQPSPVFTSNTNGVSSINISSLEYDSGTFAIKHQPQQQPMTNGVAKFSLNDNIVTISTALDGGSGSQPSSIIMIDDEKLDFSLQTLDDFDDPLGDEPLGMAPPPPPPLDFAGNGGHPDSLEQVEVRKAPEPGTGAPPLPSQRSSIISMNGGTPVMNGTAAGTGLGGFVTEITLKPPTSASLGDPEPVQQPQTPPQPAERPQQNGIHPAATAAAVAAVAPVPTSTVGGKPPIITKKPPKPEHKPTTPPSRIPVERRMSSEHSFIPRNTEIKFTTATYESPTSVPRTPPTRPLGVDQIRSNFERSNSKTEIPVLIRRTSIPSINLSSSISSSSSSSSSSTTGGSLSNLSNLTSSSPNGATKASPSRIPVFSTATAAGSKFGFNDANGGRSPPPATTNGGSPPHNHHQHNGHHHSSSNNNLVNSSKMSVSINSIKNQSKHPSGKY
uniref:Uncharacterized protein n=1 Tax=Anopheles darlingi TaxID=43151 RepID=A0A2M4CH54_ANODA